MGYGRPAPLAAHHDPSAFRCGQSALDDWLVRHARSAQASGSARVFVTTHSGAPTQIVGFYALAAAQLEPTDAPPRLLKGQPGLRPVPVVLLARLAVDRRHQGRRLGASLLRDGLLRVTEASRTIGIRVLIAHAKDDGARRRYERFGFVSSPTDELHMILFLKDVRNTLATIERSSI